MTLGRKYSLREISYISQSIPVLSGVDFFLHSFDSSPEYTKLLVLFAYLSPVRYLFTTVSAKL
jgi:hypothetical protein